MKKVYITLVFILAAAGVFGWMLTQRHGHDDHAHQDHHHDGHDHEHDDGNGHDHGKSRAESHGGGHSGGHSHGDDAQSFSGATHKEGEGITLLEETKKILGIETAAVETSNVAQQIRFLVRVFSNGANQARLAAQGSSETVLASGIVSSSEAVFLKPGTPVSLTSSASNGEHQGTILKTERLPNSDDAEIVLRVDAKGQELASGSFMKAFVSVPKEEAVVAVPKEAVIKGTDSSFVYVVNGNAFLRTCITTGSESGGRVEVREGLLEGDEVVTRGALDLWLIELRAVKGGQGCCPAPPAKNKG